MQPSVAIGFLSKKLSGWKHKDDSHAPAFPGLVPHFYHARYMHGGGRKYCDMAVGDNYIGFGSIRECG